MDERTDSRKVVALERGRTMRFVAHIHINETRSNRRFPLSRRSEFKFEVQYGGGEGRCDAASRGERPFESGMSMSLMKNRIILWNRDVMQRPPSVGPHLSPCRVAKTFLTQATVKPRPRPSPRSDFQSFAVGTRSLRPSVHRRRARGVHCISARVMQKEGRRMLPSLLLPPPPGTASA